MPGRRSATIGRCKAISIRWCCCGTPAEIRRRAAEVLDQAAGRPGHIFNLGPRRAAADAGRKRDRPDRRGARRARRPQAPSTMNGDAARPARRVAVVGGGITGLAAAHRLRELDPRAGSRLFEAGAAPGGVLQTDARRRLLARIRRRQLHHQRSLGRRPCAGASAWPIELLPTERGPPPGAGGARGRLYPVPEGFMLMAPRADVAHARFAALELARQAAAAGRMLGRRAPGRRRRKRGFVCPPASGREAFERLVQPLAGGIYTADAEQLSLAATMPRFLEMERQHGGLIRAARHNKSTSQRGKWGPLQPVRCAARWDAGARNGRRRTLAGNKPSGSTRRVSRLQSRDGRGWEILLNGAAQSPRNPARRIRRGDSGHRRRHRAARLVQPLDDSLGSSLDAIPYASSAVVILVYKDSQLENPPDGFGIVVPGHRAAADPGGQLHEHEIHAPRRRPAGQSRGFFSAARRGRNWSRPATTN